MSPNVLKVLQGLEANRDGGANLFREKGPHEAFILISGLHLHAISFLSLSLALS